MDQVHFSSATVEHSTPQVFYDDVSLDFNFTLDVAATALNRKCLRYYNEAQNAITQDWLKDARGGDAWMNPPYGDPEHPCKKKCTKKKCVERGHHIDRYVPGIADFIKKAWQESRRGLTVVSLLPSRTDTAWWHRYIWNKTTKTWREGVEGNFIEGRLTYGNANYCAPFPNALVIFNRP